MERKPESGQNNSELRDFFCETKELFSKRQESLNQKKLVSMRETMREIYNTLEEHGYNGINQLVAYLLSEDPTYITSHKNARKNITSYDRNEILQVIVDYFIRN
ncbi:MAG: IreB family regulatory phosphoprotein [Candidatus Improbicoccus pseudotrichonymphae]|uniref:IreB family regulatory phosphoprotein n=1 Tax=Candidatus Improbicoccus pseudotrichonymphae TaxID=3033792 RepID=A0AA48I2S8_9FIRM|nr:MAG: IreB family regulatory phosphoprotein [Candidatus Improbicoccus pseudotrichonymphae]